ncbi:MAG: AAA family ATPase [Minisyncoccia bacterium]
MLFGYEEKIKSFGKLIKENRLSQAYLFYGDKGIGKNSFAQLIAFALESGNFEISDEAILDANFVSKDPEESSLGIDKILEIKRFLWQKPLRSRRRLAVIDEAEYLTDEAQGALLKIVEEPPAHALLIFIAHDPQVLLPPLLSRLTKIYFPRMSKEKIKKILMENFKVGEKSAEDVAEMSFGRLGLALELIRQDFPKKEENTEEMIERNILKLRREDLVKNSPVLKWLLERETAIKRYNVNMNLQKKAIEQRITSD